LGNLDFQAALTYGYEVHYRGFDDVAEEMEWHPHLLAARGHLERRFMAALLAEVPPPSQAAVRVPVARGLRDLVERESRGPSLSEYLLKSATAAQFREFLVQRSLYHLKEADPHTWVIPRLSGESKAALIAIQTDEYGNGTLARMHSSLFAQAMRSLDLDDRYGTYWGDLLPETHATVNFMSLLGLHRKHRGAAVGHLAALEMTSTQPNRRYGNGLRRLGYGAPATAFFDEHVEADAVHEQLAAVDMCGALVRSEPRLHSHVLWGAMCCLRLDQAAGEALLDRWFRAGSSGVAS
jgi:hypothetical protein